MEIVNTGIHTRYWNELTNIGDFKISKNISRESLWYNNHITIEGNTIFIKEMYDKGIMFISDILDNDDKYNLVPNFLQYYSLCSAIPAQWKYKLRNENNVLLNRDEISLSIRGKDVPITKASYFTVLMEKTKDHNTQNKLNTLTSVLNSANAAAGSEEQLLQRQIPGSMLIIHHQINMSGYENITMDVKFVTILMMTDYRTRASPGVFGLILDSIKMQAQLPLDKRTCTKQELLQLLGHFNFASQVVLPGRSFVSYLIELSKTVNFLQHHVTFDQECRTDLLMWLMLLEQWNGKSYSQMPRQSEDMVAIFKANGSKILSPWKFHKLNYLAIGNSTNKI
ncbi:hypothetical protein KUTeg_023211 [Tegillarca granosa]|uniref:Uncharacterized protein n=1 Tax=Tegillarca granosa TaxID=220873 RepID=A0ABQ9E0Z7_TEGGR|nr:hypothetical protein KUTeg_023211 [Tegillarca granosa]